MCNCLKYGLISISLAVIFNNNAYADSTKNKPLLLLLNEKANIIFTKSGKHIVAMSLGKRNCQTITINKKLTSYLLNSDDVKSLFKVPSESKDLYVILTRKPSNPQKRTGYCGAGYEDLLLLIEVTKEEVTLKDKFLLQSCIESEILNSNQSGDPLVDPLKGIAIDKVKSSIKFEWLAESDKIRTLCVEDGHFVMHSKDLIK